MSVRLASAILIAALALTACSSGGDGPTNAAPACSADVTEMLNTVAIVERQGIQGFAGCQPDPADPNAFIIRSTIRDLDLEAVRAVLIRHDPSAADALRAAPLRLEWLNVLDVADLHQQAANLLITELPDEHKFDWRWCMSDYDETYNRGLLWYPNEESRARAQQIILERIDAPPGAIVTVVQDGCDEGDDA